MAICCNPASPSLLATFPPDVVGPIEHSMSELMRAWADTISGNSNFDDLAGFALEEDWGRALEAYDQAMKLNRSAQSRLKRLQDSMPSMVDKFLAQAERVQPQIRELSLDKAGLDFKTFFSSRSADLQDLDKKIGTLLAAEAIGRRLLEKKQFYAWWQEMVEKIRPVSESVCKGLSASVADSRQYGLLTLLITR